MSHPLVRPHLPYEDLSRLPADGHRYELLDGEAYRCPSSTLRHQKVLGNLYFTFRTGLRGEAEVFSAPLDMVLGRRREPLGLAGRPEQELGDARREATPILRSGDREPSRQRFDRR